MSRIPKYRHHKPSNRAIIELKGRQFPLGKYNSPESKEKYERVLAEYLHNGRKIPHWLDNKCQRLSITSLIADYFRHVKQQYENDGSEPPYVNNVKQATIILKSLYGSMPVNDFGPRCLKTVRNLMVDKGWRRKTVNTRVQIIIKMFKWGVSEEFVPVRVYQEIKTVEGLREGRTTAKESKKVLPVPLDLVNAVQPYVSRQIWAIIQLQLLTGARGGEILPMRACDLDMSDNEIWIYQPLDHKTAHLGKKRTIFLNPKAQEVIKPFLIGRPISKPLFSPRDAVLEHRHRKHSNRKTPMSCGNKPGSNRVDKPQKEPKEFYTRNTYRQAIVRACEKAFPLPRHLAKTKVKGRKGMRLQTKAEWHARIGPEGVKEVELWKEKHQWTPHQLRHTAGTQLREEYGIEMTREILGHSSPRMTEIYAESSHKNAVEIMKKFGS